jgi:ABC-type multidrug transport system fused ATPase/permease subunit
VQNRQSYIRLLLQFRPHLGVLCATLLALALASLADVLLIQQLQNVVDALKPHCTMPRLDAGGPLAAVTSWFRHLMPVTAAHAALWAIPATIMTLALLRMVSSFMGDYGSAWLSSHVQADLRRQMFARILRLPNDYFDQSSTGTTLSRVTFDANQVAQAGLNVANVLVRDSVSFSYGRDGAQALALRNVSLDIAAGETVALVGGSGSGKTTLASLLPRFYDPGSGRILLDGADIRDYRLADLRSRIALVGQDVVLFNDTLAANISYGDPAPDHDRVIAAARAAYAHDFIERQPQGYLTQVGDNGLRLSGGQRQRIAIARALYKDAPILILDEATSALDTESERQVQAALERLMKGRTTVMIAHRLSTIQNVDRIVVMSDGAIVETGTHRELLARGGLYARLAQAQKSTSAGT